MAIHEAKNQEEITEVMKLQEIRLQEKCQVQEEIQMAGTKEIQEEMPEEAEEIRVNKYRF